VIAVITVLFIVVKPHINYHKVENTETIINTLNIKNDKFVIKNSYCVKSFMPFFLCKTYDKYLFVKAEYIGKNDELDVDLKNENDFNNKKLSGEVKSLISKYSKKNGNEWLKDIDFENAVAYERVQVFLPHNTFLTVYLYAVKINDNEVIFILDQSSIVK
jgi:hypothetical protein